ncbi:aspartate aminotransferase family protein [Rivibacter subsaxonicus]|uniref:Diaminobutyrate--2-oxoglutarate transaminase n=1 Tax=Rivibacter subsaxonicus TaxID=457575 RepID=A0A4Q7W178_9BURK|nr:aminotransferase class III-fold pyridoxal phosphate-dependent enzyme [Rivibacter subsaxonicus]RZU02658.1 acetylornithine/succinyldiaminopimelate/putrescine aminotransferase [Rivibacter subsaxonicus]
MTARPELLSVEAAKALPVDEVRKLFERHLNPGQLHFLKLLGFDQVLVRRAEGMYYTDQNERQILDFFGGFGSVACGHNHPRILAARKRFQDEQRHEICIAFMSQYATALAHNLAAIAPGELETVFLTNCGSVANEAALKLAERCAGPKRSTVAYATNSFHGKTRAALSVTDSEFYQSGFTLLPNRRRVRFGDLDSLEEAFKSDPSIGTFIVETVQGGAGIVLAPESYWQGVRALCDKHGVIWLADEVQCGVGRTGRFFAFEHYGVVPDIVTLAKSLGGGKTAIGAYIARRDIHMKAYGPHKTALIHGPATFSGMGEGCITAIETLNVLYDEGLIDNSAAMGARLLAGLQRLQQQHPRLIKEVRGLGLMVGIEFHDLSETLPFGMKQMVSLLDDKLKGSLCGFVGTLLLRDYDTLVAFTEYNRNVIRLEPPLVAKAEHVDAFLAVFGELLELGVTKIVSRYARGAIAA